MRKIVLGMILAALVGSQPAPAGAVTRSDGALELNLVGWTNGLGTTDSFQNFVWGGSAVLAMTSGVEPVACGGGGLSYGSVTAELSYSDFPFQCLNSSVSLDCMLSFSRAAAAVAVEGQCTLTTSTQTYRLLAAGALAWVPSSGPPVTDYFLEGGLALVTGV